MYLLAALLGGLVGVLGLPPFHHTPPATPAARVGWALREADLRMTGEAWAVMRSDAAAVRESWSASLRDVFDLVVAVRGLKTVGRPDWAEAERLCHALKWSRCAQSDLEKLRERARP